jgi:IclR family transcriptional regulator, acetate operon repressor
VGMQLEAYCSGIGKVLLAHLPKAACEDYLAAGPFVALTSRTIVDPDLLRAELANVRHQGFAVDNHEVAEDLRCIAVPLRRPDGEVVAAVSVSQLGDGHQKYQDKHILFLLRAATEKIEAAAYT